MLFKVLNSGRLFSTKKYRLLRLSKKNLFYKNINDRKSMLKVMLFIPSNLSVNISKNLNKSMYNFFMYNSYIKVNAFLPLKHFLISFDIETNTVLIIAISCNSYIKQYITNLMLTYNAFFKINFKKLKFKGKGYYIYRNARNTIAPQFGYAHRLYIYS